MNPSVRATIWDLSGRPADLLVIGGGATGAGIAREAAQRGFSVALIDRHDFAWGTSSRSSRLIHGGLRYLEQRRWGLVFEGLRERRTLLRIAPHLVRPLAFLLPVYRGDRVPRWKIEAGLLLYDLLSLRGNVRRHRVLSKRRLLAREPRLRDRGLQGGALYWDAQCDDARLTLATVRAAAAAGARVANYVDALELEQQNGRVIGALVEDRLSGARSVVRARLVVNAAGPWADAVRRLEDPRAEPLLRPTRGAHVMVPRQRIGHQHAITFMSPLDGRVMFVLPWGAQSYIGTTETDATESPEAVHATADDVVYLLRSANALFPPARLTEADVLASWAGLRPLLLSEPGTPAGSVSREHRVLTGPGGMLTVAGGKLTTYRRMAEDVVRHAERLLGRPAAAPGSSLPTAELPLPGGETTALEGFGSLGLELGLGSETVAHLLRHYGAETPAIYALVRQHRDLAERLHPDHPAIAAEVVHHARREFARRVDDVLVRRIHLRSETRDAGLAAAARSAALLAEQLGWDETRQREEVERYRALCAEDYLRT